MCLVSPMMFVPLLQQWAGIARAATVSHGGQSSVRVTVFIALCSTVKLVSGDKDSESVLV